MTARRTRRISPITPRAALRAARRVLVASAVACAVVLIGGRINPPDDDLAGWPPVNPILAQPIADVRIDISTVGRTAASIQPHTPTPITFDAPHLEAAGIVADDDRPPPGPWLHLRHTTLGRALAEALRPAGGGVIAVGYRIESGTIVIDPAFHGEVADAAAARRRAYDVRDLAADCRRFPQRLTIDTAAREADHSIRGVDAVRMLMYERVTSTAWDAAPRGQIVTWGDAIYVDAPPDVHWDIQRLLFLLRNPSPVDPPTVRP